MDDATSLIDWIVPDIFLSDRRQVRSVVLNQIPRILPVVVGPKDLSCCGQSGASLRFICSHSDL